MFLKQGMDNLLETDGGTKLPEVIDKLCAGPHVVVWQSVMAESGRSKVLLDAVVGQMNGAVNKIMQK
jgi:hypothetical protein